MSDVSSRVLDVFFRDARKRGVAIDEFFKGVDVVPTDITERHARLTWTSFTAILDNISRFYTPTELEYLGGAFMRSPLIRPLGLVARLLFDARDFYRWTYAPNSPLYSVFSCITSSCTDVSESEAIVILTLKDGFAPSEVFNIITKGAVSQVPRLVSEPPAEVELESTPRGPRYYVRFSKHVATFAWLRKLITWPFTLFRAGRALKEAHESLRERYIELESTQRVVAAQALQLRTAYSISQAVHANLDLSSTLDSVARSFTGIGLFRGAYVKLDGPPMREAWSGDVAEVPSLVRTLEVRGELLGHVLLWFAEDASAEERMALADVVLPAVTAALDGARSYALVVDSQQHLEARVKQRTAELSAARDALSETVSQLEASEKARSRLFANVNHEIRTPLTLILLSVEELRQAGMLPEQDRALAAVARNARKLLRLVDGLLLLAAGDERRLEIAPRDADLSTIVSEVIDAFVPSARACDVVLRAECVPGIRAEVDELAIDRVLSNLVSNAIKFTPAGGEIVVSCNDLGDEVQFTVCDTGIGLSDAFMSRVFGRFEQDGRPVRPGAAGSGIGLSLVRDLAEAHHGQATVERLTKGTLFRVVLPKAAASDIRRASTENVRLRRSTPSDFGLPTEQTMAVAASSLRRESTVLVIEDDDELRTSLVRILSTRYYVLHASSGEDGLGIAEAQRPDLLVTDVGLPGMDGIEVTRRFRALPGNRMAPVLVLTAFATLEARLSGFEAGAVDYVTKPFDPNELLARTQAQLDRRRLALQLHESEKLAAVGTMAAGLAHEMRNPANALVNAVEPLIELLPAEVKSADTGVSDLLSVIRDCASQIGMLSRQLLGFRRGAEIDRELTDGAHLVERALGMLRPALRNVDLRLDLQFQGMLSCAPALVLQVLGNLFENATHAALASAPSGSKGWVRVSTFRHDDRFVLEVTDSGPGVPVLLRERIFEPFFTTKPPGEGTGLGLSTSRQVAERHRGSLHVVAAAESTFRFELPLSVDDARGAIAAG